ncbi:DUF2933 domain-containing protein [Promicromonospora soli]
MMKRQQWGLYAVALAILIVGLVAVGVPVSTLLIASLILVCPLMMIFMMRGTHGNDSHGGHGEHHMPLGDAEHHTRPVAPGVPQRRTALTGHSTTARHHDQRRDRNDVLG